LWLKIPVTGSALSGNNNHKQVRLPSDSGTYGLHLRLARSLRLQIGRLGEFTFPAGDYIYVGSALGAGGLQARINHHLRRKGSTHWHIDWLEVEANVVGCWYVICEQHLECVWAQALMDLPETCIPAPGFGASDCSSRGSRCAAHLLISIREIDTEEVCKNLAFVAGLPLEQVGYCAIQRPPRPSSGLIE
jgi:Uri superfamily endonuclease